MTTIQTETVTSAVDWGENFTAANLMTDVTKFVSNVTTHVPNVTDSVFYGTDTTDSVLNGTGTTYSVLNGTNTTHVYDTWGVFIHPHWYHYGLIPPVWHYAMGVFITIVSIFGASGNLLVIYMFGTTRTLRTPSNMFIVNLSMSDFIFSVIQGFPLMTISCFTRRWIFGKVACEMYGLVGGIFGLMSINTLAAIALDRYNVITRPVKASRRISYRKAFLIIIFVWFWSTVWTMPPLFGWGAYILEGFQTSCTFDYLTRDFKTRVFILCLYIGGFTCPLLIILFCYFHIFRAVARHEKEMGQMAKQLNAAIRQGQGAKRAEIKTAKIAMTIILTFLLSWTPYATVALIAQFGPAELVTPYVSELPVMFAKASAMHNPIIYALSHPRFREAVNQRFPWLLCCCGVKDKETLEADAMSNRSSARSEMRRMDSVNSNVVGGTQSQTSEMSNLECETPIDDVQPAVAIVSTRIKSVRDTGSNKPKEKDNKTEDKNQVAVLDVIQLFANAMEAVRAGDKQTSFNLPPDALAIISQNPELQKTLDLMSQSVQVKTSSKVKDEADVNTSITPNGSAGTSDAHAIPSTSAASSMAQADDDGKSEMIELHTNKNYETD